MAGAVVVGATKVTDFNDVSILPVLLIKNPTGDQVVLRLEGHHIINQATIRTSAFLQALQDADLWDGSSFAQNGIALPANRVLGDGPSPHTGGHSAYNRFIGDIISSFNQKFLALHADLNAQPPRITAEYLAEWLERGAKTINGLTAYLKAELTHFIRCAPTARSTSGGRFHPESCRLIW